MKTIKENLFRRPGPRINLAGRRGAQTTTTTTEASKPEDDHVTGDEEDTHAEAAASEKVRIIHFLIISSQNP